MAPKIARIANLLIVHLQSIYIHTALRALCRPSQKKSLRIIHSSRLLAKTAAETVMWLSNSSVSSLSLSFSLYCFVFGLFFLFFLFLLYGDKVSVDRYQGLGEFVDITSWISSLPIYCTTTGAAAADEPHKSLYLLAASFYVLMRSKSQAVGNVFVCLSRRLLGRRFHPFHFHKISK
jgi:hypothetical protein